MAFKILSQFQYGKMSTNIFSVIFANFSRLCFLRQGTYIRQIKEAICENAITHNEMLDGLNFLCFSISENLLHDQYFYQKHTFDIEIRVKKQLEASMNFL